MQGFHQWGRLGDMDVQMVRGVGRVGPSLTLALPLSGPASSMATPSPSASGDQEAEALSHLAVHSQQSYLSRLRLLLTGSAIALHASHPPSLKTRCDSGRYSFRTFSS